MSEQSPFPKTVRLEEIEMLRIHNAHLQLQTLQLQSQPYIAALDKARKAASARLGVDIQLYEFDNEGNGTLKANAVPNQPAVTVAAAE